MISKLYRRLLFATVAAGLAVTLAATASASGAIPIYIDGVMVSTEVPPRIIRGKTMLSVRDISEILGCTVDWVPEDRSVVVDGVTLMQLRFVAESIGYTVKWNSESRSVHLISPLSEDEIPGTNRETPEWAWAVDETSGSSRVRIPKLTLSGEPTESVKAFNAAVLGFCEGYETPCVIDAVLLRYSTYLQAVVTKEFPPESGVASEVAVFSYDVQWGLFLDDDSALVLGEVVDSVPAARAVQILWRERVLEEAMIAGEYADPAQSGRHERLPLYIAFNGGVEFFRYKYGWDGLIEETGPPAPTPGSGYVYEDEFAPGGATLWFRGVEPGNVVLTFITEDLDGRVVALKHIAVRVYDDMRLAVLHEEHISYRF